LTVSLPLTRLIPFLLLQRTVTTEDAGFLVVFKILKTCGTPGRVLNPRRQPFQGCVLPPYPLIFQQLNFTEWPQFCDQSVTSADVRLSVGQESQTVRKGVLYPSRQIGPKYIFMGQIDCRGVGKAQDEPPDALTRAAYPSQHPFLDFADSALVSFCSSLLGLIA
jgi:hypothetical protein